MTYTWEDVKDVSQGEVFTFSGHRYKVDKKTSTAIAIRRWYWFDDVAQWIGRKLGSTE